MRTAAVWTVFVLLVASPAVGLSAATRAEQVAECIRLIEGAKDVKDAAAAYSRGCSLDAKSVKLYEAYLRRMLKFGLPQVAVYPARVLVKLRKDHPLAWGVLGHFHGKRKEWPAAYDATALAVVGLDDDPSVLHNAGQLVAWRESLTRPPKLSDRTRIAIDKHRAALLKKPQFAKAYQAVKAFFAKQAAIAKAFDAKIYLADAEKAKIRAEGKSVEAAMRDIGARINVHRREISRLRRRLDDTHRARRHVLPDGRIVEQRDDSPGTWRRRRQLQDDIRREEDAISVLDGQLRPLRGKRDTLVGQFTTKKREIATLRKDKADAMGKVDSVFRWDPPAVDGEVTAEVPVPRMAFRMATSHPAGPEADAARQLRLAKMYLAGKMSDKGLLMLQSIISKYPKTAAGKEARKLLAAVKADDADE